MSRITWIITSLFLITTVSNAQQALTPEKLWTIQRVGAMGISKDEKSVIYRVSTPNVAEDKMSSAFYSIDIVTKAVTEVKDPQSLINDKNVSSDGKWKISSKKVKLNKVSGSDFYPAYNKSNVQIFDALHYRHWDTWMDGTYNHSILTSSDGSKEIDLLEGQPFHCPQLPFGGDEDYVWNPNGKSVLYVTKKKSGTAYAISTNTDLYEYEIATGKTTNLTEGMLGYDTHPLFSRQGTLAWLSMARDGFEADKQDIIILQNKTRVNLTKNWDESVQSFIWSNDGKKLFFTAAVDGTLQLFEVSIPNSPKIDPTVKRLSSGDFDVNSIVGQVGNQLVVTRTSFNRTAEIYLFNLDNAQFSQLTSVNDVVYQGIKTSKTERRMVKTTDGKDMLVWVIYPPDFDPTKKYPTLLYCQGGPQSPLTQSYSFRWNFQLMAAQGYIVVAPNRRGMPGHGTEWNEAISKDWGGQVMDDYLSAIDAVAEEPYVDRSRLGAVGASYGGYSVFYLAGIHKHRFKTFIAHAGVFNTQSMYGTTEELFFVDFDMGGPYWDYSNEAARKTYTTFNPASHVQKWDTPILILHGAKDYRVPLGQGLEAFQAAQLRGIQSKLVIFPEENHWITKPQNGLVWQSEFFKWLKETL